MDSTHQELRSLLAVCRKLMLSILTVSRGEGDRHAWPSRVRVARRHVQAALLSLSTGPDGSVPSQDDLDRIAASLRSRLVRGMMAEVDGAVATEEESGPPAKRERDGFHGFTWSIGLPDLMGFLQMQQKSGVLRVNIGTEAVSLIFDEGDLIQATSDNAPPGARLGEILVAQGALDMPSLEAFLVGYCVSPGRLGESLEAGGLITRASLQRALDTQVEGIFERLFTAKSAYYAFREGHTEANVLVRRNVFQLLLETCRTRDESEEG